MIILFLFWKHVGELSTMPSTTVKHLREKNLTVSGGSYRL